MNYLNKLIADIELHSVEGIRDCFRKGVDPNQTFRNDPLIYELTSEYTRSPNFKECVRAFVDQGLRMEDKALMFVLLDDAASLETEIDKVPSLVHKKYSLRCAYTQMIDVNLLHICAEFNHVACAEILIKNGVGANVKAGVDEHGFGGQTPIFHTVNQNGHQSKEMLYFLLANEADLKITVPGLIWGKGYEWETFIPSVNPISYCMMGLLPQMHRNEKVITETVSLLLYHAYGIEYEAKNIPNAYLKK